MNSVENVVDRISFVKGIKDAAIEELSSIMTAVFVYYSSYLIVKKRELGYKSEDFLFLVFAILFESNEIVYYLSIVDDLKKASFSAKKVLAILEKEPRVDQVKDGQNEFTTQFIGRIEFIDVGFKYKTRPKKEEQLIQSSLSEFDKGKITKVIVAHRLATVSHAEKIIALKDGHVEEEGTHDDLIKKNGL